MSAGPSATPNPDNIHIPQDQAEVDSLKLTPMDTDDLAMLAIQKWSYDAAKRLWQGQELKHDATHDELTGVLNKRGLLESMNKDKFNKVLFADGTNIKAINDFIGHDRGDEAIIGLASVLKGSVRSGDIVARVGGDEFVILLGNGAPEGDPRRKGNLSAPEQLKAVEDRINNNAELFLNLPENEDIKALGAHIATGSALWRQGERFEDVRTRAERNMTSMKESQHNDLGKYR